MKLGNTTPTKAVLSIGSNTVDSLQRVTECINWLANEFELSAHASAYTTPAVNGKDADYVNTVAVITTTMSLPELNAVLKDYEKSCGRTPESKQQGAIPIDVDIVMWNQEIVRPNDYNQNYFKIGWREIAD